MKTSIPQPPQPLQDPPQYIDKPYYGARNFRIAALLFFGALYLFTLKYAGYI